MEAQSLVFAVQASAPGFAPEAILVLADEQCRDVVIDESVHDGSLLLLLLAVAADASREAVARVRRECACQRQRGVNAGAPPRRLETMVCNMAAPPSRSMASREAGSGSHFATVSANELRGQVHSSR